LEIMEEEDLPARSAELGERLLAGLSELAGHPNVGEVRGRGLLAGLELVEDKESRAPATAERVAAIIAGCKRRGLLVGKNGDTVAGYNNILQLSPPLIVTKEDVSYMVETVREAVEEASESRP
jgi:taurine-pyruvate aminotransferase